VNMIAHQSIRQQPHSERFQTQRRQPEIDLPVGIAEEHVVTGNAALREMVSDSRNHATSESWHSQNE